MNNRNTGRKSATKFHGLNDKQKFQNRNYYRTTTQEVSYQHPSIVVSIQTYDVEVDSIFNISFGPFAVNVQTIGNRPYWSAFFIGTTNTVSIPKQSQN